MRTRPAVYAFFHFHCRRKKLTHVAAAKQFGCSWQYLHSVLIYKRPMPPWLIQALSTFLQVEPGIIGLAFGYYPDAWIQLAREQPELCFRALTMTLGKLPLPHHSGIIRHRVPRKTAVVVDSAHP